MKRNEYTKPTTKVVKLERKASLLSGSDNTGNNKEYGGPVGYADSFLEPKT